MRSCEWLTCPTTRCSDRQRHAPLGSHSVGVGRSKRAVFPQEDRSMKRTCLAIAILSVGVASSLAARGQGRVGHDAGEASASERSSVGSLVPAPAMSAGRIAHSATALPDGRVLVAGGFLEKGSTRGAEIYDSDAGRFSPLPAMLATRHSHTATLLPDGNVLIAGGYGEGTTTLAAAEVFDPNTNSFVPTGSLVAARAGHVAALLNNGRVRIAGRPGAPPQLLFRV